jgi:hypothetical protein
LSIKQTLKGKGRLSVSIYVEEGWAMWQAYTMLAEQQVEQLRRDAEHRRAMPRRAAAPGLRVAVGHALVRAGERISAH